MPEAIPPQTSLILYQREDGRTRSQSRFENEAVRPTQAQMANLFNTSPQNVTPHLNATYREGKSSIEATCKDYLQVRNEGGRTVSRFTAHRRRELVKRKT